MTGIPPVRMAVEVRLQRAVAFELFTTRMPEWWPYKAPFSRGPVEGLVFEAHQGGELRGYCVDGGFVTYARVLVWEPPERMVVEWMSAPDLGPSTEVEVRFTPTSDGCRLELEHRGFECYGAEEGRRHRESYAGGWPGVLALFLERASRRR